MLEVVVGDDNEKLGDNNYYEEGWQWCVDWWLVMKDNFVSGSISSMIENSS